MPSEFSYLVSIADLARNLHIRNGACCPLECLRRDAASVQRVSCSGIYRGARPTIYWTFGLDCKQKIVEYVFDSDDHLVIVIYCVFLFCKSIQ